MNVPSKEIALPNAAELTDRLRGLSVEDLLRTASASFAPGRIAVLSAFGPASLVVLHKLHALGIRLPVLFIDTLHHFPETLGLVERAHDGLAGGEIAVNVREDGDPHGRSHPNRTLPPGQGGAAGLS